MQMKTPMRRILTLMTVAAGGSLCLGLSSHDAEALPSSAISAPAAMPTAIESAQYYTRRQWRRRGPVVVVPNATVTADPDVEVEVDDDAISQGGLNPPIVAIVPVRPAICGEFRYWNGNRCVDARYNDPYLGPR
jgi:hypothetical protein